MKELKNQNRYKKIILILILAVLLLTGFLVTKFIFDLKSLYNFEYIQFKPIDKTANWQVYRNEQYGFEIKYPLNYVISDKRGSNGVPSLVSQSGDVALDILIYRNLASISLEDWLAKNLGYVDFSTWVPVKVDSVSGLISTEVSGNMDGGRGVGVFFLSPDKKNVYNLLFGTYKSGMETELNVFDQMLASFKFIR